MSDVVERLRDLDPVPRDPSTGWSESPEGVGVRARLASPGAGPASHVVTRRRPGRRLVSALVAAAVVLAVVGSAVVLRDASESVDRSPAGDTTVDALATGRWRALAHLPSGGQVVSVVWTGRTLIAWGASSGVELVDGRWRELPDWASGTGRVRWSAGPATR